MCPETRRNEANTMLRGFRGVTQVWKAGVAYTKWSEAGNGGWDCQVARGRWCEVEKRVREWSCEVSRAANQMYKTVSNACCRSEHIDECGELIADKATQSRGLPKCEQRKEWN